MRPIKFRAWDKETDRMLDVLHLSFDESEMSNELRDRMYQQLFGQPQQATSNQQPTDRAAASLGALDAHGLASLRQIILTVIDDGDPLDESSEPIWVLYSEDEAEANEQRLRFCDAIQAAIVTAAPATTAERWATSSRTVIVPNELAEQIYAAIDRELEKVPDAAADRENFYLQILAFYDDHGYIPNFSLHKQRPETAADDPDYLNPAKGGNRASDGYWGEQ